MTVIWRDKLSFIVKPGEGSSQRED